MSGSLVQVYCGGVEITGHVLYEDAVFEMQMNAIPGTCSFRVFDRDQALSFTTGQEVRLLVDGVPMWGGYIRRVSMTYPFDADDTSSPTTYRKRIWLVEGADYNVLWDNLILRRTADYTTHVPDNTGYSVTTDDGWAVWKMLQSFSDFPTGFDITSTRADATEIDDVTSVLPAGTTETAFFYKEQSTKLRDQMDEFCKMSGATYYISADKKVHYHAYESLVKRWGFSDDPNYAPITSGPGPQDSSWGFREVTAEEDGTLIYNDAIIWGGSDLGSSGHTIVARYQDSVDALDSTAYTYIQHGAVQAGSSIDLHGRWQIGETHFDGGMYGNLSGVKARATTILHGPPGTSALDGVVKGYRYPQWSFRFNWFANRVPTLSGVRDHIVPGEIVRVHLATFGKSQYAPCRSLSITFPGIDEQGLGQVLLGGEFSYSYTDSVSLWKELIALGKQRVVPSSSAFVSTSNNSSTTTTTGSIGTFTPTPTPDGATTVFSLPNGFGYIAGSLEVYVNGLLQDPGSFTETSPSAGTFTLTFTPVATDTLYVNCRTA